ncbi:hypothetical protein R3X28_08420 [Maribacter sp. TH_r10]|uniref:Uncharacterized protein n=1 Tax=Maribacter luteus TaxID=2594478 RepID=A0A6I2MMN9_9FLAO|nr:MULTISPECIES: hypothetical protein [Maribacter]MDV7138898.1 hypothetical protein [Maribacter sp. TH_r10]MRX63939.1 hypothetical protein [Maribacter luteus]
MKMKNLIFGILAFVALAAVTYDTGSSADEGQSIEQGIHKDKLDRRI